MRIATGLLLLAFLVALPLAAEDRAVCAVCGPREGSGFEPVKATATYKGKQYFFCSTKCKVDFLKNPESFLVTDAGQPAPAFRLKTFDGKAVSLSDFRGQVVLLDFWATFCPPCVQALPELQALHSRLAPRGFAIVGVTVDDRAALVKKATSGAKVAYPIVQATPEVWNAYKVNALPSLILVGRDGNIIKRYGGEADKAGMIADIESALRAPFRRGAMMRLLLAALLIAAAARSANAQNAPEPEECLAKAKDAAVIATYGDKTYRLTSVACRDQFMSDPERYSQLYDALLELEAAGTPLTAPATPSLVPS